MGVNTGAEAGRRMAEAREVDAEIAMLRESLRRIQKTARQLAQDDALDEDTLRVCLLNISSYIRALLDGGEDVPQSTEDLYAGDVEKVPKAVLRLIQEAMDEVNDTLDELGISDTEYSTGTMYARIRPAIERAVDVALAGGRKRRQKEVAQNLKAEIEASDA